MTIVGKPWSEEYRRSIGERLYSNIDLIGECWVWKGKAGTDGYARIKSKGKMIRVHRASFAVEHGFIPPSDRLICHDCDNPLCVRPKHLFEGTGKDNAEDREAKGRGCKGRKRDFRLVEATASKLRGRKRPDVSDLNRTRKGSKHSAKSRVAMSDGQCLKRYERKNRD